MYLPEHSPMPPMQHLLMACHPNGIFLACHGRGSIISGISVIAIGVCDPFTAHPCTDRSKSSRRLDSATDSTPCTLRTPWSVYNWFHQCGTNLLCVSVKRMSLDQDHQLSGCHCSQADRQSRSTIHQMSQSARRCLEAAETAPSPPPTTAMGSCRTSQHSGTPWPFGTIGHL